MKLLIVGFALFSLLLETGCSNDPKAATSENFARVISHEYDEAKIADVCKDQSISNPSDVSNQWERESLTALHEAGLITVSAPHLELKLGAVGARYVTFTPTSNATSQGMTLKNEKSFLTDAVSSNVHLCPERVAFDHIVDFTEPAEAMGVKIASVRYALKVIRTQPWLSNAKMVRAFQLTPIIDSVKQPQTKNLVLTNTGWQDTANR